MFKTNDFIICLVAPSGAGKTTLANKLKWYGYKVLDSYTTRPPRHKGEKGHVFVSKEQCDEMKDDMVAYTFFDSYEYYSTKQQVMENDIYVIDPDGVQTLKEKMSHIKILTIYIHVPESQRIWRMGQRGDDCQAISKRISNDEKKFAKLEYDYAISNDDTSKACYIIDTIICKEVGKKIVLKLIQNIFSNLKKLFTNTKYNR